MRIIHGGDCYFPEYAITKGPAVFTHSRPRRITMAIASLLPLALLVATPLTAHARSPATAQTLPTVTTSGAGTFAAVSCMNAANCVAVGHDQVLSQPMIAVEHNGNWLALPDQPSPVTTSPLSGQGAYFGVSCATVGTCVAVGTDTATGAPLVVTSSNGVWSPATDLSATGTLSAISCPTTTFCVAVGGNAATGTPLTARLSGGQWAVSTPWSQPGALYGVSCVDTASCTAVGVDTTDGTPLSTTLQGGSWTTPSDAGFSGAFNAISCTTASDCVAVGVNDIAQQPAIETEVAGTWNTPTLVSTAGTLNGVDCSSSSVCTAVGQDLSTGSPMTAVVTSGQVGTPVDAPVSGFFTAVSCPSDGPCVRVGQNDSLVAVAQADGAVSTVSSTGTGPGSLSGVSCTTTQNCVAVGQNVATLAPMYVAEVNGTWGTPTDVTLNGSLGGTLSAISCSSGSDCVAVGQNNNTLLPLLVTETAGVWGAPHDLVSDVVGQGIFTAVSCASSGECVAVGHEAVTNTPFAIREHNGTWGTVTRLTTIKLPDATVALQGYFTGVSCPTTSSCTAVGYDVDKALPFVTSLNNNTWSTPLLVATDRAKNGVELNGISCVDSATCMAVGVDHSMNQAAYLAESNGQWAPLGDLLTTRLRGKLHSNQGGFSSVSCAAAGDCTAAGDDTATGRAFFTTQTNGNWDNATDVSTAPVPTHVGQVFNAVSCTTSTTCTMVGLDPGRDSATVFTETNHGTKDIGPATHVVFLRQPSLTTTVGKVMVRQPIVAIEDVNGNIVTNNNSTIVTLRLKSPVGRGICKALDHNGIARLVACHLKSTGHFRFVATTLPALKPARSHWFRITPKVPKRHRLHH